MSEILVGPVESVPEGTIRRFETPPGALAVANMGRGRVFALLDACTHMGARLSMGELDPLRGTVVCPWHGSEFLLETGEPVAGPAQAAVPVYPARVADGDLVVEIADA
jgi:nitrite reductase/ring-hydroxylating ferredoxin subunit